MVLEKSYDSVQEFVPVKSGDAFDITPAYLDRTFSERGLYLMDKSLGGNPSGRVLFTRSLLDFLNVSERGSVITGAILMKNDPKFENRGIAGMSPYDLLKNCITISQSTRAIFQSRKDYNFGREWEGALKSIKQELGLAEKREIYKQPLLERVKNIEETDILLMQSSILNYAKERPKFNPDLGEHIRRRDGYKSNKAQYIKQVMESLKNLHSSGNNHLIESGQPLDLESLDALRHGLHPF